MKYKELVQELVELNEAIDMAEVALSKWEDKELELRLDNLKLQRKEVKERLEKMQ